MASNSRTGIPGHLVADWAAVRSAVAELHLFWRFHVGFCGNHQDVSLMEEILPFPYLIVRKALLFTIVMQVRSLLDRAETRRRKKTLDNASLARLVKMLEADCPALHVRLTAMLDDIRAHCQPICHWGDKRVCHADRLTVLSQEKLPEVDQQHFQKALDMMREFLNQVHAEFHDAQMPMHFPEPTGDPDKLLDYIRTGHRAKQAEVAALLP